MRNLYVDPTTGDLTLDDTKNLRFTTTTSEFVSQKVEDWLAVQLGEWFLNRARGFGWYEEVLKKGVDLNAVKGLLINYIQSIPEVESVLELNITVDAVNRGISVDGTIKSALGEITPIATVVLEQPEEEEEAPPEPELFYKAIFSDGGSKNDQYLDHGSVSKSTNDMIIETDILLVGGADLTLATSSADSSRIYAGWDGGTSSFFMQIRTTTGVQNWTTTGIIPGDTRGVFKIEIDQSPSQIRWYWNDTLIDTTSPSTFAYTQDRIGLAGSHNNPMELHSWDITIASTLEKELIAKADHVLENVGSTELTSAGDALTYEQVV